MHSPVHLPRPRRAVAPLLLAAAGCFLMGALGIQAASPFVAGEPSSRSVALDAHARAAALDRAARVGRALGLPDGPRAVERLDDRFDHAIYDEVTTSDGRGRPVAITRLTPDGGVVMAVALGWRTAPATIDAAGARERAAELLRAADLAPAGRPRATALAAGGWTVAWPRTVDGVPVRGDGVRLTLWPDGALHALAATAHPLAARPGAVAGEAHARAAAEAFADGLVRGEDRAHLAIASASLAWVAPNDTFSPARPDAPEATLRLAWVVELRADAILADRLRGLEVWLDAGSLDALGGDVAS